MTYSSHPDMHLGTHTHARSLTHASTWNISPRLCAHIIGSEKSYWELCAPSHGLLAWSDAPVSASCSHLTALQGINTWAQALAISPQRRVFKCPCLPFNLSYVQYQLAADQHMFGHRIEAFSVALLSWQNIIIWLQYCDSHGPQSLGSLQHSKVAVKGFGGLSFSYKVSRAERNAF